MEELLIRATGHVLRVVFHKVPEVIVKNVPHAHEGLSLASLYVFVQALGLLWVFLVSLCAVIGVRLVNAVVTSEGGKGLLLQQPVRSIAVCYLHYTLVRNHWLFGKCLWTCAWEMYHNFPTLRRMLLRSRRGGHVATPVVGALAGTPFAGSASVDSFWTPETPAGSVASGDHSAVNAKGSRLDQQAEARLRKCFVSSPELARNGSFANGKQQCSPRVGKSPRTAEKQQGSPRVQGSPRTHRTRGNASKGTDYHDARRYIALMAPLVVMLLLNVTMLVGQVVCEAGSSCADWAVFDPTGRINRNSRFVLFIAILQWLQAWIGLFPNWYAALSRHTRLPQRAVSGFVVFFLLPASLIRLAAWLFVPAGIGVVHRFVGLRHHLVDSVLVAGWSVWLLVASVVIARPSSIRHTGFRPGMIKDDSSWRHFCCVFKYTFFLWMFIHFIRGCLALGPAHAQNDLIAITILYPMLLCLIWLVTFVTVAVFRYALTNSTPLWKTFSAFAVIHALLFVAAYALCASVHTGSALVLVVSVWLHFGRQVYRVVCRWTLWGFLYEGQRPTTQFAIDPNMDKDMKRTYQVERRLGRVAIRVLVLICVSFLAILCTCALMAGLQQRAGLFMSNVVWWRNLGKLGGFKVTNTRASELYMARAGEQSAGDDEVSGVIQTINQVLPAGDPPHYAVCGHTWHGLQLLDYAMMSMATYVEDTEQADELLNRMFPHLNVTIVPHGAKGERRWMELVVQSCPGNATSTGFASAPAGAAACQEVSVIAVSGTDPTRITDYTENLRMWTEPVSLQILSTVFPTVRIWPRDTTAMVIGGIHGMLKSMGVSDDQWHYREILDHVRRIPADREVVVTGHSLGGGISLVIGALTDRLAIAIQPPGVYHSLAKHQAQQAATGAVGAAAAAASVHGGPAVHKRSVSLIFEGDWIQNFDGHGGLVQTMGCDQSRRSIAVGCHLLEGAICHLLWHCGDQAQRFGHCQHHYLPASAGLDAARNLVDVAKVAVESWHSSKIPWATWDSSFGLAWFLIAVIAVARYGAPSLPRLLQPS